MQQPFWIVDLPDDRSAKDLASRSMSLRCILELWGHSNSKDIHTTVHNYVNTNFNELKPEFDKSFRITVETFNRHITQKEKVERMERFSYLPLKGDVDLKNPEINWWYIEYYGLNHLDIPEEPYDVVFGKWVSLTGRVAECNVKTKTIFF